MWKERRWRWKSFHISENAFPCFAILLLTPLAQNTQIFLEWLFKKENCLRRKIFLSLPVGEEIFMFYVCSWNFFNVSSREEKHAKLIFCLFSLQRDMKVHFPKRSISLISALQTAFYAFISWILSSLLSFEASFKDGWIKPEQGNFPFRN